MAISVDTVYQRVLALANKEQRGYIPPVKFNLFANQAQLDIFEQYFFDLGQLYRRPGNDTYSADTVDILEDKIAYFESRASIPNTALLNEWGDINLSQFLDFYRLIEMRVNYGDGYVLCEELSIRDFETYSRSPLAKHTEKRPVYMHYHTGSDWQNNRIKVYPYPPWVNNITNTYMTDGDDIRTSYIRKPRNASWNGVVINTNEVYNDATSKDFDLHPSEETKLVMKILQLAAIAMKDSDLYQIASSEDMKNIQQEKQ